MRQFALVALLALLAAGCGTESGPETAASEPEASTNAAAEPGNNALCVHMGPQTPRDIASASGLNTVAFALAPEASEMNLCNIHTHTNAEHKGPGFSVFVSAADDGGFA